MSEILMKLTSLSTIAHGDAGTNAAGPSNVTLFHRQPTLTKITSEKVDLKTAFDASVPGRQRACILHFSAPKRSKTRKSRVEKCMRNSQWKGIK